MKVQFFSIITVIGIISLVALGIYILLNPETQAVSSITNNIQNSGSVEPQKLNCSLQTFSNLPQLANNLQQSAISLAENSNLFRENTKGLNYTIVGVSPNFSFNTEACNNFTRNGVGVYFKLSNGSSLGIFEDGEVSRVTGVSIPHVWHGGYDLSKSLN